MDRKLLFSLISVSVNDMIASSSSSLAGASAGFPIKSGVRVNIISEVNLEKGRKHKILYSLKKRKEEKRKKRKGKKKKKKKRKEKRREENPSDHTHYRLAAPTTT